MAMTPISQERTPSGPGEILIEKTTIADPSILAKPNAYYGALRSQDPVHFDPQLGMYLISRHEDLETVLRDAVTFSQEQGWGKQFAHGFFEEFKDILIRDGGGFFPNVVLQDPPKHTRIRRLLEKAFTAHRMKLLEPQMTKLAGGLIDKFAKAGNADGVKDFATPMTIGIICEMLGFEHADTDKILKCSQAYTAQIGRMQTREQMRENARLICDLQNYIIAHIRDRQARRREDMISDLIDARLDDEQNPTLTFDELVSLISALLVGGNDTTGTALGNLFFILATEPGIAQSLYGSIDDDRVLTRFVEELLRFEPPVRGLSRVTTKEVELGGKRLPAGSHLLLLFASADDDEEIFACPRRFDMSRENLGKHMSFGAGVHRCVGAALARMEIRVALREILKRLKDIKLAVPADEIGFVATVAMLTMKSLPLTFSPRQ